MASDKEAPRVGTQIRRIVTGNNDSGAAGIALDAAPPRTDVFRTIPGGVETCLRPFDVFVQNGTRHAWRNKSSRPATFAVVLLGVAAND